MEFFKKILSSSLILLLVITTGWSVSALSQKHIFAKEVVLTKSKLHKVPKGRTYAKSIDTFIEKLWDDLERIEKIHTRVWKIITKYENKIELSQKEEKMLAIFYYLEAKLQYRKYIIFEEYQNSQEAKAEKKVEEILNSEISSQDKKDVEDAIVNIQTSMIENMQNAYFDIEQYFLEEIEKQTNYQATGDMEFNYDFEIEDVQSQWSLSLENYSVKNSLFDSQMNAQIHAVFSAMENDQESVTFELKTLADLIQKDGRLFGLLKDLEITSSEEIDDLEEFIQRTKDLAKENKYLELSDSNSQEFYDFINNFHSEELFNDMKTYWEKPFFTAYKKVDDTYYLIPTKYACDSMKQLQNIFDPFGGEKCTDAQYKEVLKELVSFWEMSLQLGNSNIFNFEIYENPKLDSANINIEFNNNELLGFDVIVTPNKQMYPNDGFSAQYNKNENLDFSINIADLETYITFKSTLDRNNSFDTIDFEGKVIEYNNILSWEYRLKNNAFVWEVLNETFKQRYDDNWQPIWKEKTWEMTLNIEWNFDRNNSLEELQAELINSSNGKENFKAQLSYDLPQFSINIYASEDYSWSEFVFIFDGQWDENDKYFRNFDLDSHFTTQEVIYDNTTWEIQKTGKILEIFNAEYSLHNNTLEWDITLSNFEGELIATVKSQWEYYGKKWDVNTLITIKNDPLSNMFGYSQAARDSKRMADVRMMQMALEQVYQDNSEYPTYDSFHAQLSKYIPETPEDSNAWEEINGCKFGYKYYVSEDNNGIENQNYKLETCFESDNYMTSYDYWIDDTKYEVGVGISGDFDEGIYINDITSWEIIENELDDLIIDIDTKFDYLDNKTDLHLFLEVLSWDKKYGSFEIKNTGEIEYKKQNIELPEHIAPMQEILY